MNQNNFATRVEAPTGMESLRLDIQRVSTMLEVSRAREPWLTALFDNARLHVEHSMRPMLERHYNHPVAWSAFGCAIDIYDLCRARSFLTPILLVGSDMQQKLPMPLVKNWLSLCNYIPAENVVFDSSTFYRGLSLATEKLKDGHFDLAPLIERFDQILIASGSAVSESNESFKTRCERRFGIA